MSDRVPRVSALGCPSVLDVHTSDASPGEEDNPAHGGALRGGAPCLLPQRQGQERQAAITMNDPLEALLGQEERLRHLVYDTCARLGYSILSLHLELRMPRHGPRLGVRLGGPTVLRLYGSVAIRMYGSVAIRMYGSTGGPILTGG